jgi:hypothetical protein
MQPRGASSETALTSALAGRTILPWLHGPRSGGRKAWLWSSPRVDTKIVRRPMPARVLTCAKFCVRGYDDQLSTEEEERAPQPQPEQLLACSVARRSDPECSR